MENGVENVENDFGAFSAEKNTSDGNIFGTCLIFVTGKSSTCLSLEGTVALLAHSGNATGVARWS